MIDSERKEETSENGSDVQAMLDDGVIRVDGEVKVSGIYQLASEPKTDYAMVWLAFNGFSPSCAGDRVHWHGNVKLQNGQLVDAAWIVVERSGKGWRAVCQYRGAMAAADDKVVGVAVVNALRRAANAESDIPVNQEHVAKFGFHNLPMWELLKAKTDKH